MNPSLAPAPASLELREVGCARGGRLLFGGVSLRIAAGQWLRVSGGNGAGKSSLLRVACGLLPPEGGQVLWRGQPLGRQRGPLGLERLYLGHAPALKEDLSALENLRAACALAGEPVSTAQALEALEHSGLQGHEHLPVRRLSQGQRRRCSLARLSLARQRPLWVLDEPFDALDTGACDWLTQQLAQHLEAGGLAILTSHQPMALETRPHQELRL